MDHSSPWLSSYNQPVIKTTNWPIFYTITYNSIYDYLERSLNKISPWFKVRKSYKVHQSLHASNHHIPTSDWLQDTIPRVQMLPHRSKDYTFMRKLKVLVPNPLWPIRRCALLSSLMLQRNSSLSPLGFQKWITQQTSWPKL